MARTVLLWLRNDLRIADNPALRAALEAGDRVEAIYVHETDRGLRPRGAASRWWLHHSLNAVAKDLARLGIGLEVVEGESGRLVPERAIGAVAVFWNRRYGPAEREHDAAVKERLKREGIEAKSCPGNVLLEPFDIATKTGTPYSVYTPFWQALKQRDIPAPLPKPRGNDVERVAGVDPGYREPDWGRKIGAHWAIGESAARRRLETFLDELVADYPEGRDLPRRQATSRLSPHLALGEISARQVWHAAMAVSHADPGKAEAIGKFLSELAWRDFNHHQLYHREDIARVPMVEKYGHLEWRQDAAGFHAWTKGMTGIPIVDAGMRELWETGVMHNRVRMLTASLLAKNLLVDWHKGEEWFWDTLVDADAANNPGNWQWVAGSGLDASPYFRIFNPVTQGEKFDPDGEYVRRWVPEVRDLPDDLVHKPWDGGGVKGYPTPIVDLKATRERALAAFKAL
jgi:deoxyribodipyrimidine photo-lyase